MMRLTRNKTGGLRMTPDTNPAISKYAWDRNGTQNASAATGRRLKRGRKVSTNINALTNTIPTDNI